MKKIVLTVLTALAVLSPGFAQNYTIEAGGSTSVTPLMEQFAAAYARVKPGVKVNINPTGSGDGIKNAGTLYQIGMTSRELTAAEKGQGLKETVIAIDGIAVIVHRSNPVADLSVEQIRDIYSGAITDWSQVSGGKKQGRIAVNSREAGSGTRGAFEELVGLKALVRGANESTSTGAIKAGVAQNPDAIGYISLGSLDRSVRALSVGGVAANAANVKKGSYKIARPFIVLSRDNAHAESKAFLAWMLGKEAQEIVKKSWIAVR
ncbi:MAG: phosphate ABC transporter substrate-binding protein [Treponema sp.]|jgi:phosphate transport system substrate-binding protein|nr:phosphate ABC transporter substrate-binding protein [Treponema sp.]